MVERSGTKESARKGRRVSVRSGAGADRWSDMVYRRFHWGGRDGIKDAIQRACGGLFVGQIRGHPMELSDFMAGVAVVVAVAAAYFTHVSSKQAKRQADAVLGDLPPIISLYQVPAHDYHPFAVIAIEIINYNRRPIHIARWEFDFPDDMYVFQDHDDNRESIAAIMAAIVEGQRDFVFDLPLRMPGAVPQMAPITEKTTFNIAEPAERGARHHPTAPFDVSMTVWYRVDGEDQLTEVKQSITWVPVRKRVE